MTQTPFQVEKSSHEIERNQSNNCSHNQPHLGSIPNRAISDIPVITSRLGLGDYRNISSRLITTPLSILPATQQQFLHSTSLDSFEQLLCFENKTISPARFSSGNPLPTTEHRDLSLMQISTPPQQPSLNNMETRIDKALPIPMISPSSIPCLPSLASVLHNICSEQARMV
jgi:hypothetical protein